MIDSTALTISKASLRTGALTLALLIYAAVGDPTPDRFTLSVALTGAGLVFFLEPVRTAQRILSWNMASEGRLNRESLSSGIFVALLLYPTLVGAAGPWDTQDIVRDAVPHAFLFMPVLVSRPRDRARVAHVVLPVLLSVVGVAFSVRYLQITGASVDAIGRSAFLYDGLLGLTFDPSVVFAAIWLPFAGIRQLNAITLRTVSTAAGCVAGALICVAALGANVVRLPIVLILLGWAVLILGSARRHPIATATAGVVLLGGSLLRFRAQVAGLGRLIFEKQLVTGDNGRLIEWTVVIDTISRGPGQLLFGDGWGALLQTPGYHVAFSFTHNVFSYYLFKAGLLGMVLVAAYLIMTLRGTRQTFKRDPALTVAAGLSLANAALFQPTFKAVTFGLVLTALTMANIEGRGARPSRRVVFRPDGGFGRA